jgi:hypothetical protein
MKNTYMYYCSKCGYWKQVSTKRQWLETKKEHKRLFHHWVPRVQEYLR